MDMAMEAPLVVHCFGRADRPLDTVIAFMKEEIDTHAAEESLSAPLFLPFRSFLGILRLDMPNSAAIPNSRRPKKSSPRASAKLPLEEDHRVIKWFLENSKTTYITKAPSSSSSSSLPNRASSSNASTAVYDITISKTFVTGWTYELTASR